jgi:hypothetical protein
MMEAARISETSVNFYQTTRRNSAEDSHLHTCHREKQKSHLAIGNNLQRFHCAAKYFAAYSLTGDY